MRMSAELSQDRRALLLSGPQHYDATRPLTCGARRFMEKLDSLGIAIVSRIFQNLGFSTYWAEMRPGMVSNLDNLIGEFPLVAISSRFFDTYLAQEAVKIACGKDKITLVGGYGPTFSPENFDKADIVVQGECETVLPEAIDDLLSGRAKHIYDSRKSPPLDLKKSYIWPDRSIFPADTGLSRRFKKHPQEWQRGCSNYCTFCSPTRLQRIQMENGRRQVRVRSVDDIIKEIAEGMELGRGDRLFSVDLNSSAIPTEEQKELYGWLKQKGIKWYTEGTIAPLLKDYDLNGEDNCLLKVMSPLGEGGGCYSFLYGADDLAVQKVPGSSDKEIGILQKAKIIFKEFGIPLNLSIVVGLDEHIWPDTFYRYASLLEEVRVPYAFIHLATPYPGTVWGDEVAREGRIFDTKTLNYNHRTAVSTPGSMSTEELQQGYYWLMRHLNSVPELAKTTKDNLDPKIAGTNPELALVLSGLPWGIETHLSVLELAARGYIDLKKQREMDDGFKAWQSRP